MALGKKWVEIKQHTLLILTALDAWLNHQLFRHQTSIPGAAWMHFHEMFPYILTAKWYWLVTKICFCFSCVEPFHANVGAAKSHCHQVITLVIGVTDSNSDYNESLKGREWAQITLCNYLLCPFVAERGEQRFWHCAGNSLYFPGRNFICVKSVRNLSPTWQNIQ